MSPSNAPAEAGAERRAEKQVTRILLLLIAVFAVVPTRTTIPVGPVSLTYFTLISTIALLGTLLVPRRIARRARTARIVVPFIILLGYATSTVFLRDTGLPVTYRLTPLLDAFLAITLAVTLVARAPLGELHVQRILVRLSTILVGFLTLWYFVRPLIVGLESERLTSNLGGASVVHILLLLSAGVFYGAFDSGFMRRRSALGLCLAMGLMFLSGSRAGLAALIVFVASQVVNLRRPVQAALFGLGASLALLVLWNYFASERLGSLEDAAREINYQTGLHAWRETDLDTIFGVGSGVVWPWFAHESASPLVDSSSQLVWTEHGLALWNPHSLYIGVLVELGVMGLMLLALSFYHIPTRAVQSRLRGDKFLGPPLAALVISLGAFAVDYYLLKNFPLSFVWWFVLLYIMAVSSRGEPQKAAPST